MDFPYTRHPQRYEYVCQRGFADNKVIMDVGCGWGYGSSLLATHAREVFAVDYEAGTEGVHKRVVLVRKNIYNVTGKVDVCVAIEIFEHMKSPTKFVKHLATLCDELFITTPLAKKTGKTNNPEHVREYSKTDFERIVSTKFKILERKYQTADMRILDEAKPNGSSYDHGHVVQMLWCRRNGS